MTSCLVNFVGASTVGGLPQPALLPVGTLGFGPASLLVALPPSLPAADAPAVPPDPDEPALPPLPDVPTVSLAPPLPTPTIVELALVTDEEPAFPPVALEPPEPLPTRTSSP